MSEHRDEDRASRIARRAYERYVARGQAQGHDLEDWLVAEREVAMADQDPDVAPDRLKERVSELATNDDASDHPEGVEPSEAPRSQRSSPQPRGGRR